jgi:hypothetical protein
MTNLEDLPNEVQLILFGRYFTLDSLCSSVFGLNNRYNMLLVKLLPKTLRFSFSSYSFTYSLDYFKFQCLYTIYYLSPSISHWPDIYWHLLSEKQFNERKPSKKTEIIVKYPIILSPDCFITYFSHTIPNQWLEAPYDINYFPYYRRMGIGRNRISSDDLERKYPEKYDLMKNDPADAPEYYKMFFDCENRRTRGKFKEIHEQIQTIWTELRKMID